MTHISLLSPIIFDSMFFVIRNVRAKNSKSLSRNRHNPELWPFDVIAKVTWINKTSQRIVWRLRVMWYIEVLLVSQHWFKVNHLDWNVNVERLRMQARSSRSHCWGGVWKRTSKTFKDEKNARRIADVQGQTAEVQSAFLFELSTDPFPHTHTCWCSSQHLVLDASWSDLLQQTTINN